MSGQEVALIPATAADRWQYAESLSAANMLPSQFRGRPADVFYAVEYGAMLGLSPIAALTGIHVIEGKPSASAALMSALVRRAGHRLRVRVEGAVEDGTITATAELVRLDDPDHTFTARWTLDRAVRAGLLTLKREGGRVIPWSRSSKGLPQAWEKFPEAMLKARAISEVARDGAEECLFGAHYTAEELGADVDSDGAIIVGEVLNPVPSSPPERPTPPSAPVGAPSPVVPGTVTVDAVVVPGTVTVDAVVVEDTSAADAPAPVSIPPTVDAVEAAAFAWEVARRAATDDDVTRLRETFRRLQRERPRVLDIDVQDAVTPEWVTTVGAEHDGAMTLGAWLMAVGRWVKANGRAVQAPAGPPADGEGLTEDPWALPAPNSSDLPAEARAANAALNVRSVDELDRIKAHAGPALLAVDITWAVSDETASALHLDGAITLGDLIHAVRLHVEAGDGTTVREATALAAQH